jgi:hypothetical protein
MKNARDSAYSRDYAETLGFRLVHESVEQVYRGSSRYHSGQVACEAKRIKTDPCLMFSGCGFRLVADGGE